MTGLHHGDVRMALDAVGHAIERAAESGAGVSEMVGLALAVRVLSGMLPVAEVWDDVHEDAAEEVDDELCPF